MERSEESAFANHVRRAAGFLARQKSSSRHGTCEDVLFAYWQSHAREFCRYIAAGTLTVVREKQKRNLPAAEQSDELHGARNKLGATIDHAIHIDQKASAHDSLHQVDLAPDRKITGQ
jgi:hypothetical protein